MFLLITYILDVCSVLVIEKSMNTFNSWEVFIKLCGNIFQVLETFIILIKPSGGGFQLKSLHGIIGITPKPRHKTKERIRREKIGG